MQYHVLLFYKFQEIKDPESFRDVHKLFCDSLGLAGKILVATEGLNGSVSGSKRMVDEYKQFLWSLPGFEDVVFKMEISNVLPFKKMFVRVRDEIIVLGQKVDLSKKGEYISPIDFLALYDKDEEVIILDTRNKYEVSLGHFKNAINPGINSFREFPVYVESISDLKDKKIVMYCTGGIRCEKASAYMKGQGFANVSQLEGGVITFCQKLPNTAWQGKCFVFDKRLKSSVDSDAEVITQCDSCGLSCDAYRNCNNVSCDRYVILCNKCDFDLQGYCSKECFLAQKVFIP